MKKMNNAKRKEIIYAERKTTTHLNLSLEELNLPFGKQELHFSHIDLT